MNLYQKREAILQSARQEISHYGISAFRVEEIARILGMSKRTIYRIFPTKADLLRDCIILMGMLVKGRISLFLKKEQGEPMETTLRLLKEYVNSLYDVEGIFLRELKHTEAYKNEYLEIRQTWSAALVKFLEQCKQKGDILENTNLTLVVERLLTTLCESRIEEELPSDEQIAFCHTILRGIATQVGMSGIEEKQNGYSTESERCYS